MHDVIRSQSCLNTAYHTFLLIVNIHLEPHYIHSHTNDAWYEMDINRLNKYKKDKSRNGRVTYIHMCIVYDSISNIIIQDVCHILYWHNCEHMYEKQTLNHCITMMFQWARWRLISPASRVFTQQLNRAQINENIKVSRHWPLCGEFTGDRWIPHTNGQ